MNKDSQEPTAPDTTPRQKHAGGRPRKIVTPSVANVTATPTATVHQPGSPEKIAELVAKHESLDSGTFKTGQMYDADVKKLEFEIAHHKELQKNAQTALTEEGPAYRLTVTHVADVWGEADKELTREARTAKQTISSLNGEVARLKLRIPSADLWDAQEKKKRDDAQAIEDAKTAEEKRAERQTLLESNAARLQSEVSADQRAIHLEETRPFSVLTPQYPYGQPGTDNYRERQAVVRDRENRVFELTLAEGLVSGEITDEQAKEMRTHRWAAAVKAEGEAEIREGKRKQDNAATWRRTPQPGDPRPGDFMGFVDEHGRLIK